MKSTYQIPIIYNDLHKGECIEQVIENLHKLETVSQEIFGKINTKILEKKTKIENIKSRIQRSSKIISTLETMSQALTIKSAKIYPDGNPAPVKSIYYNNISDFSLHNKHNKTQDLNTKPYNPQISLNKPPNGTIEDIALIQEIINSLDTFKDIKNELDIISIKEQATKKYIDDQITNVTSIFHYIDKTKAFGDKSSVVDPNKQRDSFIVQEFMNSKQKQVKKPEDAPKSIVMKTKLTEYKQKKELIRRNTSATNIEVNLPKNLNLPLISDLDVNPMPLEDCFSEEFDTGIYIDSHTAAPDDVENVSLPIDKIKEINTKSESRDNTATVNQTTTIPNIPSVPKSPNVPSVPNVPNVPKVPNVPSVPKAPAIQSTQSKSSATNNTNNQTKAAGEPNNNEEKKSALPPVDNQRGGLLEQIRQAKNSVVLKKTGSILVPQLEPKKKPTEADNRANVMNLLKQQIDIRFANINKHNKPVKKRKDSFSDSESD